jgi:O-methyltransferase involved in polyketide biosynthesis
LGDQAGAEVPDVDQLSYAEARTDAVEWLAEHGWDASATTVPEAVAHYRRGSEGVGEKSPVPSYYISACRSR